MLPNQNDTLSNSSQDDRVEVFNENNSVTSILYYIKVACLYRYCYSCHGTWGGLLERLQLILVVSSKYHEGICDYNRFGLAVAKDHWITRLQLLIKHHEAYNVYTCYSVRMHTKLA